MAWKINLRKSFPHDSALSKNSALLRDTKVCELQKFLKYRSLFSIYKKDKITEDN